MAIPEQFLDELTARCDIADVVADYVPLTRKGNNLWGLCPFHGEKTPSFSVSPDKQIYHCFGCGKGGGVQGTGYAPPSLRVLCVRPGPAAPRISGHPGAGGRGTGRVRLHCGYDR